MGSIYGKFADQDSTVLSGQIQTSNNNQISLNAAIAENDQLRSRNVALHPTNLTITPGNLVPNVAQAIQSTVGAALGDIGQAGTASQEPGGGGVPCFVGTVLISMPNGLRMIEDVHPLDVVLAFDAEGKRVPKRVTDKFEHLVEEYTNVTFANGRKVGLIEDHKFWQRHDKYVPIRDCDFVWHWDGAWKMVEIIGRETVRKPTVVYNFTVADFHNYIADGFACSNLKPLEP